MSNSKPSSRWKLFLIPVLAAALFGILMWPDSLPESVPAELITERAAQRESLQAVSAIHTQEMSWNHIQRTIASEFNPFLVPPVPSRGHAEKAGTVENPNVARHATTDAAIGNLVVVRVQAVTQVGTTQAALIDGKVVRVGDEIPGRGKVAFISTDRVVIEAK